MSKKIVPGFEAFPIETGVPIPDYPRKGVTTLNRPGALAKVAAAEKKKKAPTAKKTAKRKRKRK